MAKKIFVSYKYADKDVEPIGFDYSTTARDYVTKLQSQMKRLQYGINKGEKDDEDLSYLSEDTIWSKLKDRIYDSSLTIVLISPNMKEYGKHEYSQWIPWEISFSLRETTRNDRTSHSNAIVSIILPNCNGSYEYFKSMKHFNILKSNIDNGYIEVVKWSDFLRHPQYYINKAKERKANTPKYKIIKSVKLQNSIPF